MILYCNSKFLQCHDISDEVMDISLDESGDEQNMTTELVDMEVVTTEAPKEPSGSNEFSDPVFLELKETDNDVAIDSSETTKRFVLLSKTRPVSETKESNLPFYLTFGKYPYERKISLYRHDSK